MPELPSNSAVANRPIGKQSADEVNELFRELDKEKPEISVKPEEKEESEEKKDDELELVEPEEEIEKLDLRDEEEDLEIDAPPRKKEILKEYPDVFKKFPFLEKMLYRDKQYTELFGSFDDAKEIAEKAEIFNEFESELLSGNTERILREVKETDDKAFNLIVDDYLSTLAKVDKDAYWHVTGNLNKRLIMEMIQEANSTDNEDLKQAALLVNQFVFGTAKFTPPTRIIEKSEETDNVKREIENERLSFVRERFESTRDEMQMRVDNKLRATISEYIDPKNAMSSYVKKNAVNDAMKYLGEALAGDESITNNLDRLWRSSFDSKFSMDSQRKIESYYLSKAKSNLKQAILKARAEALKDNKNDSRTRETDEEEREEETPHVRKSIPTGKPSQSKGKNERRKGESVSEFFMRD